MPKRALGLLLFVTFSAVAFAQADAPSGLRLGLDPSILPGDNFYGYANGGWVKATEIPPDQPGWGPAQVLVEETNRRLSQLLESAGSALVGTDARRAGDFYASYMDELGIEAKGLVPLQPELSRISKLSDKKALSQLLGEQLRADVDPINATNFSTDRLFGLWVSPALSVAGPYVPYLLQGGLGLPDRAYYLDASAEMASIRVKYQRHIAAVLKLARIPDGTAKAARIFALETKMARVHAPREDSEDVLKANNPWKRTEFSARAPGLDWAAFFAVAGLDKQPVVFVWQPAAIRGLSALVTSVPLSTWKEYLAFHAIDRRAEVLPKAFGDEHFAFYGKALSGTPQRSARWKRAVAATNAALGDAVGQLYVKRYFPPEAKAQVQALVKNILAAFAKRIDRLEWMAPQTKAKAKEKLGTIYVGVGYPERWVDYSGLQVVPSDAFGNAQRSSLFEYHRRLEELGRAVDRMEWCMAPQTVNAVNMPLLNSLNFPAAILQPPYFDPNGTSAANYGSIGAAIGHEISHSFDDQGSQFDAQGRLANWWTKEDLAHFQAAGALLVSQFNSYRPFPDLAVNGKQTLSENIADLAGLAATHDAWLLSLDGKAAPMTQGFSGEQDFFLSYAQSWRSKVRAAALRQQLVADGHAPDEYRADTVRNMDAWYTAFDVKPGQTLYLDSKDRVRLW